MKITEHATLKNPCHCICHKNGEEDPCARCAPTPYNKPKQEEWEKRLDTVEFGFEIDGKKLKKFIKSLLKAQREEILKEGMTILIGDNKGWAKINERWVNQVLTRKNGKWKYYVDGAIYKPPTRLKEIV